VLAVLPVKSTLRQPLAVLDRARTLLTQHLNRVVVVSSELIHLQRHLVMSAVLAKD
jgi:hypothetical protein